MRAQCDGSELPANESAFRFQETPGDERTNAGEGYGAAHVIREATSTCDSRYASRTID